MGVSPLFISPAYFIHFPGDEVEGPQLPVVSMTRQLEVYSMLFRLIQPKWLMIHQNDGPGTIHSLHDFAQRFSYPSTKTRLAQILTPHHIHGVGNSCQIIPQNPDPVFRQIFIRILDTADVLMIACDRDDPVSGSNRPKRLAKVLLYYRSQILIHHIPREENKVGIQGG